MVEFVFRRNHKEWSIYLVLTLQLVEEDQERHGLAESLLIRQDDVAVLDEGLVQPILAHKLIADELQILGPKLAPLLLLILSVWNFVHETLAQMVLIQALNLGFIYLEHNEIVKDGFALLIGEHLDSSRVFRDQLHAACLKQTFVYPLDLDDVVAICHLGGSLVLDVLLHLLPVLADQGGQRFPGKLGVRPASPFDQVHWLVMVQVLLLSLC